ncbi:FAD-dependent oxidoreductase [Tissierella sp. MB52-C2]|uniref:NAD(P)/FAD-dependent oxidoreductase n=1 Tax=Tissierella sp. MB52-C2 TaxID=3070999 RepID=UPI00280C08EB|nr:FAD-dependent oxidoreductase [Tissierella sp. MB52-C2]WMM24805.1 FAD-dependent oxidoreductase [Tissierella sp. MB52-C2]
MQDKIIIIGNGIAAISAIKAIREVDMESEIHLFGEEVFYPYSRIRLSKGLLSTLQEDKILLQKREWYDDNNVNLYLGTKVVSIDIDKKVVRLFDDSLISYTKILIATGSNNMEPNIPGVDKNGVYSLRTLQNAWDIADSLKDSKNILIIGGGIQGLEIAWILSQINKEVTIAHNHVRLMTKQLDSKASKILENNIRANNVQILFNCEISEILGNDKAEGFKTSDGKTYNCDTVIYSIGTSPNIELLKDTPIELNRGIVVDEKMETSVNGIFAAGDAAEYNDHIFGLWNVSIGQGKVAGYNITDKDTIYEHITPLTTLNAFDISLFSMGIVDESMATDIVLDEKIDSNIYNKVLINDGKIIGAIVVGNIKSSPVLKSAIEKKTRLENINYKDISFDNLIQELKSK